MTCEVISCLYCVKSLINNIYGYKLYLLLVFIALLVTMSAFNQRNYRE